MRFPAFPARLLTAIRRRDLSYKGKRLLLLLLLLLHRGKREAGLKAMESGTVIVRMCSPIVLCAENERLLLHHHREDSVRMCFPILLGA